LFFYFSGLYDNIPKSEVYNLLEKCLPKACLMKIKKYTNAPPRSRLKSHLSWQYVKEQIDNADTGICERDLINLFQNNSFSEKCVKIFHISKNDQLNARYEPTLEKTCQMIYHFLTYTYQRNVLATIIKYILLKKIIFQFDTFPGQSKKGIFSLMQKRLTETIFECILTAFNGSNYDVYLLCNHLIIIQTKLKQKIKIFKKGSSISTVILQFNKNLNYLPDIIQAKKVSNKKPSVKWLSKVYIKDIRNLVAANMSLDKIGHLFNLEIPKLCFPYHQATTIKKLKSIDSLHPRNNEFWKDSFSTKTVSLETRLHAQNIFEQQNFKNLYEYNSYYLTQDCLLLHAIVYTLFNTYLKDDINIFLRRNFSQSSLSYQQFFIIEPAKQIKEIMAPKKIKHTFFNYLIKQAVTGGICTSFVHGNIDESTIINDHLNYIKDPPLNKNVWPNFYNLLPWKKCFNETAAGISTIDIRSLYPSAACKKLPVNAPLFFSRFTKEDLHNIRDKKLRTLNLQSFCTNVQENNHETFFALLNKPPGFQYEFSAIKYYLQSLPHDIQILRFQSSFTALGQLYFDEYPIDGFLSYKNPNDNKIYLKIIQYNSNYYHGHKIMCKLYNQEENKIKERYTQEIKCKILNLWHQFKKCFNLSAIEMELVELAECDYFSHKIPIDKSFLFYFNKEYTYSSFLENIYAKKITGFIVVKNLEIKKYSQNPLFGFLIQKVEYDLKKLSPYSQKHLKYLNSYKRVIAINKCKSFMVISTEYFNWLHDNFGFEGTPQIYHALLFQTSYYLKENIEKKLNERKQLKDLLKIETNPQIRQNYEVKSELIKLMLNSCYGFTLCNLTSTKFKHFENRCLYPRQVIKRKNIVSCVKIVDNVYLIECKKEIEHPFQTLLGHIGCSILFWSKIILLKRLFFLLRFLNPTQAQLLYMDTDSAHFLLKHKNFEDNVDTNLKPMFCKLFPKHFETGNKLSGIWVQEGFYKTAEYLGEKSYKLNNDNQYLTHMKGLNNYFQNRYATQNIDIKTNPFIAYNTFLKSPDFIIFKSYMSKDLFSNFMPIKRYFVIPSGSLPLKF